MDPAEDRDLLFIAKEGLKAPLPDPWYIRLFKIFKYFC